MLAGGKEVNWGAVGTELGIPVGEIVFQFSSGEVKSKLEPPTEWGETDVFSDGEASKTIECHVGKLTKPRILRISLDLLAPNIKDVTRK